VTLTVSGLQKFLLTDIKIRQLQSKQMILVSRRLMP